MELTKNEAYAVAELIDISLYERIRNDTDIDSMQWLINTVHAYEKLCRISGYVGLADNCGKESEEPLSWDDVCRLEMIGKPVWNSNTLNWMLIIDSANDGTWIDLINHAGGHEKWIEHDLRRNPLYRYEMDILKSER